jgi:rubrerythrin
MFTAKQYRAKAAEYREYLNASRSPAETSEFRNLEQTYTTLANNEEWLALNADKIIPASDNDVAPTLENQQDKRVVRVKDDERILRCLAAWAV